MPFVADNAKITAAFQADFAQAGVDFDPDAVRKKYDDFMLKY